MQTPKTWAERTLVLRLLVRALFAVVRVCLRRVVGRPLVREWSLMRECIREIQATMLEALCAVRPAVARAQPQLALDPEIQSRVESEWVTLGKVQAAHIWPRATKPGATLFYLHGGGYNLGSVEGHRELVSRIALGAGVGAWSIEYRLAPENPFPAAVDDAEAAWRALLSRGLDPSLTVIGGDSAGGALACALLQRLKASGDAYPVGMILIAPATNVADWGASMDRNASFDYLSRRICDQWMDAYLGDHPRSDPLVSPQFADPTGWPPTLIQAGGREVLLDQIEAFAELLTQHGVQVEFQLEADEVHVYHVLGRHSPEALSSIARIAEWMRAHLDLDDRD